MIAFNFFEQQKKFEDDPEEYRYLHSMEQVRGLRKISIVLYDGFKQRQKLLEMLRAHNRGQIFYELGIVK